MRLTKYCANGNDFLICNAFSAKAFFGEVAKILESEVQNFLDSDLSEFAKSICDRHFGVGADGFVALVPLDCKHPYFENLNSEISESELAKCAYKWIFYNSDGSIAQMCGNASRCVASFAVSENLAPQKHKFLSLFGVIDVSVDSESVEYGVQYALKNESVSERGAFGDNWILLDTGVPHLVSILDSENAHLIDELAPNSAHNEYLQNLRRKYNANVSVGAVLQGANSENLMRYATFERGVEDITLACGTGAAAVMVQAVRQNLLKPDSEKLSDSENSQSFSAKILPTSLEPIFARVQDERVYLSSKTHKIAEIFVSENFRI